ncbi:MAG: hypothetical protein WBS18_08850 [Candidatus Acidiferrales bacterium]
MMVLSTTGTIHVGRSAMDSKVGFGLKIAPITRPNELTGAEGSPDGGGGATAVTMEGIPPI